MFLNQRALTDKEKKVFEPLYLKGFSVKSIEVEDIDGKAGNYLYAVIKGSYSAHFYLNINNSNQCDFIISSIIKENS